MRRAISGNTRISAWVGNLCEHYDNALFGCLSPFLAPLMFPDHDPVNALILTYLLVPLGMWARPLGALFFGMIGDRRGRAVALFWTLGGMACVSLCIALIPSYAKIGVFAPALWCLSRVSQNFFAAGETMGGALFVLENSPQQKHDFLSGLYNMSTMGGHLLASAAVFILGTCSWIDPGWRLLYIAGGMTALCGWWLRRTAPRECVVMKAAQNVGPQNLVQTLWTERKALVMIIVAAGFASSCYMMALVFLNGFIPMVSTRTKAEMMGLNTYLILFDLLILPLFGWVAARWGRQRLMLSASVCAALWAAPLFLLLEGSSWGVVIGVRMVLVMIGVAFFAPFHAWAVTLLPKEARYQVISLGYALGYQLLGSPAAAVALWCFKRTGLVWSAAWYWMGLAVLGSLAVLWGKSKAPAASKVQLGES